MKKRFAMLMLALSVILTGCGAKTNPGPGGTSDGAPKVAVYATLAAPLDNWDPSTNFDFGIVTLLNMYETLLRYNPDSDSFTYLLAESYSASEDGLTWTFNIRQGCKFHDGSEVNAEAVKYSFERTKAKGLGAAYIWDPVESFEVTGEYTLVMHLKYPYAMDLAVSSPYAAFVMSPTTLKEHENDDWMSAGNEAGSGPYMLEKNTSGEQIILTRFDDYWGGWKENQFDKVVLQKSSEASSRRLMLENGEADFVSQLPAEDVEALRTKDNIVVSETTSFENTFVTMNCQKAPLNDLNVRKALSYAFPYEDVIKYAVGGYAKESNGPVPDGMWGHAEDGAIGTYTHDLEKAKECLAASAYPDGGFSLSLTYVTGTETQRKLAELFQSELKKLNIELDILPMTSDMFIAKGQSNDPEERQDLSLLVWYPDVPSPYTFMYTIYHQSNPLSFNWTYYQNDEFDTMIDQANTYSATDRQKSIDMFVAAQQIVYEDAPAIIAYDTTYTRTYNKTLEGYVDNPAYPNAVFFYDCTRAAG